MLASITPLGERGRGNRWTTTAGWYGLGSLLGGVLLGLVTGGLGAVLSLGRDAVVDLTAPPGDGYVLLVGAPLDPPSVRLVALGALACALAAVSDAVRGPDRPAPGPRRQVERHWLTAYRGWVYAVGFGLQLGLAVVTIVSSAATWALVVLLVLVGAAGGVGPAAALGAVAGLARALPLLATRRVTDTAALDDLHQRIAAGHRPVARATVGGLVALAALLGVAAVAAA